MSPTLVVLAAGMGARFGGLKQMEPMGPHGETVLDYSVFDALRAGFGRVVFVIRAEFADAFQAKVGIRYAHRIEVAYAYQDLNDLPVGHVLPAGRTKPWGTVHAVLAARAHVSGPFAVINADDFYGRLAYVHMARHLGQPAIGSAEVDHYCMAGYKIRSTLSSNGGVNRGVCLERNGLLVAVEEHTGIALEADGVCRGFNLERQKVPVSADAFSSMNFWGFTPRVMGQMATHFADFLAANGTSLTAECYIPSVVDHLIRSGQADCRILDADSTWFGVTYPEDKPTCVEAIRLLVAQGTYPADLWG